MKLLQGGFCRAKALPSVRQGPELRAKTVRRWEEAPLGRDQRKGLRRPLELGKEDARVPHLSQSGSGLSKYEAARFAEACRTAEQW